MAVLKTFNCPNGSCSEYMKDVEVWVKMDDKPVCEVCKTKMLQVWKVGAVKTGDGFKK